MTSSGDSGTADVDAFSRRWRDLLDRVRQGRWHTLSHADRAFYATNQLRGSVMRGGFHPYFSLASKREVRIATAAFRDRGAPEVSALIERAEAVLFPNGLPDDFSKQCEMLPCWTEHEIEADIDPPWSQEVDAINRAFYALAATVDEIVLALANAT